MAVNHTTPADEYDRTLTVTPGTLTLNPTSCQGDDPPVSGPLPDHTTDPDAARTVAAALLPTVGMYEHRLTGPGITIPGTDPGDMTGDFLYIGAPGDDGNSVFLTPEYVFVGPFTRQDIDDLEEANPPHHHNAPDSARAFVQACLEAMNMPDCTITS